VKFVIVGLGSIGKKHQKNLLSLNHQVVGCHRGDDLKQLLVEEKPNGVFICNPTSLHLKTAMIVAEAGINIFIEKPISHNLKGVDELLKIVKQKKLVLMVGYNLRFQLELEKIKKQLGQKFIGKVKSAKIFAGSYLPDWHPDKDHRQSYSAKKNLGGGVLLDLSHEIDYAVWFFGGAKTVKAKLKMIAELEIETEAVVDLEVKFASGVVVKIHLDYLQKKYKRNCKIVGENGQLSWDYQAEGLDDTYVAEVKNFIQSIEGKEKPLVAGEEAKHVLEIIEAAKRSSKIGKIIKL